MAYAGGLLTGDLGTSYITRRPIAADLADRFPATLRLALAAMLFAITLGVGIGILGAWRPGTWWDRALTLGEKLRFGARVATSQIRRARWVFFGHVGPARVQSKFPSGWQRPYGVFLHGVEVWSRLSDEDRAMLRNARVRIANSRHTARATAELNADIGHIDVCPLSMSPDQEAALAHIVPDKVIRAYKRAKFLDMRRELLEAWGAYVERFR